ncbi:hypothetical protein Tco_0201169 [Tanacetum coccineum]
MVFNSPCLTDKKELIHHEVEMVINSPWIMPLLGTKGLASPEQTATVGLFNKATKTANYMVLEGVLMKNKDAASSRDIQLICAEFSSIQVKTQADWMLLQSSYFNPQVPTGRVVVPTGRYVVPAGKVIIIVSPGRLSLVPTGRVLSPGTIRLRWDQRVLEMLEGLPSFKVQLGEDPIQAQRGGLRARREGHVEDPHRIHLIISPLVVELVELLYEYYPTDFPGSFFDAPPGYVGLYTHSPSLANLRLPLTEFFCEVLEYFQPSIDLFRGFFNLCRAGKWLTFAKRSEKHILNLLPKVITRIEGWHELFFYVQDSIIPAKHPQLLSERNKLDSKSFKDKLPPNIKENPMFQCHGRYPTSVYVFPDPILFLAGLKPSWEYDMAFRNFIYTEDDEDLAFLPKEPTPGFGTADSREIPKPELFVVHPGSVAARIKDRKCKTRGGSSRPPVKRKLSLGSSTSRATRAKTSSSKDDASFLTVSDDDEGLPDVLELKDVTTCHLKISPITPPA